MNRPFEIRNCVRILLINGENELLLMGIEDSKTHFLDNKNLGKYWFPVGGKIEEGEDFHEAAIRELFEETGLKSNEVEFGPIVWEEEFEMVIHGVHNFFQQKYIVVHTNKTEVSGNNLTDLEKSVFKGLKWFTHDKIKNFNEKIFPSSLATDLLADIFMKKYPEKLIKLPRRDI